jgi:hypothetical protein
MPEERPLRQHPSDRYCAEMIEREGVVVTEEVNGFSIDVRGEHLGNFTLDDLDVFKWGWVGDPHATSRTEYTQWSKFLLALRGIVRSKS